VWSRFSLSRSEGCIYNHNLRYPYALSSLLQIMPRQKTEPVSAVSQRRRSLSDPLAAALRPPENESADERQRRLHAEEEARRISDNIDDMIRAEKKEKRVKQEVKVLLLGQSESGKSTTLKRGYTFFYFSSIVG
jgi:tRNA U34 5-carboxymethylaminomethyl modifying GTPase MnmE/TrmE